MPITKPKPPAWERITTENNPKSLAQVDKEQNKAAVEAPPQPITYYDDVIIYLYIQ